MNYVSWGIILALLMVGESFALGADVSGSASETAFEVREYRVLGNTRLTNLEIESVLYPLLGPDRKFEDIEAARVALEKSYHEHGYGAVYVDIPEQRVQDGLVRLHVTEGRLDRIRTEGARYYANRELLARLPAAKLGETPDLPLLQKEIAAVNARSTDYQVVPVLKAGQTPGTVELDLKVADKPPVHVSLEVDNRYTADSKPLRATGTVSYDNLWGRGDSASFEYQTAPQAVDSVKVWSGTYAMRFGDLPPVLSLYAISTNSSVATLGALSVLGAGNIYGSRLTVPMVSENSSQSFAIGIDYKKFRDNVEVTTSEGISDEVNYLALAAAYNLSVTDPRGLTSASLAMNTGVRPAALDETAFDGKRFDARGNFLWIRASMSRLERLPLNFSAFGELDGQLSPDALISNEEFSAGGATSVRGYYEAEVLGDQGLHGSFELRSPPLGHLPLFRTASLFSFFDWATIGTREPLSGEQSRYTIDSTGVGLRIGPFYHFDSGVDWAYPLRGATSTLRGQDRVEFFVRYSQ